MNARRQEPGPSHADLRTFEFEPYWELDVLPETGEDPIDGLTDIPSGVSLDGITERTIRLRASLSTANSTATPILHDWSVSHVDVSCASDWSESVKRDSASKVPQE